MPRFRTSYPADFRGRIVALARAGRCFESLAPEFEPCAAAIAGWIKQAGNNGGVGDDGPTSLEREELTRLRRKNPPASAGARYPRKGCGLVRSE